MAADDHKTKAATESLFKAIDRPLFKHDTLQEVKAALAGGADPNARNAKKHRGPGARPLHLAAEFCSPDVVRELLAAGAKPDTRRTDGHSALSRAMKNEQAAEIASLLAEAGAAVDGVDKKGGSALGAALGKGGSLAGAKRLLELGARWETVVKSDPCPIHQAVARLDLAAVAFMIKEGAPVGSLNAQGEPPMMALMKADAFKYTLTQSDQATERALAIFKALREAGAEVGGSYGAYEAGRVSLFMAGLCAGAPEPLLAGLVEAGGPADAGSLSSNFHVGPAYLASNAMTDRLELGYRMGLDVNWRDSEGNSLGHWAMRSRSASQFEALEAWLAAGGDPSSKNKAGESLLHFAITHDIYAAADRLTRILIDAGADPNGLTGPRQAPPLAVALQPGRFSGDVYARPRGCVEIIKTLAEAGACLDIHAQGEPLLCQARLPEDRAALLKAGADPTLAAVHLAKQDDPELIFNREAIDEWVAMGASAKALIEAYPAAWARSSDSVKGGLEKSGAFSYLETLALREEMGSPPAPGAPRKGLSL